MTFRLMLFAVTLSHVALAQADSTRLRHAGIIDGLVADSALAPIEGATVSVLGSDLRVVTRDNGRFRMLGVPQGEYVLLVRRLGYEGATASVLVEPDASSRISFALNPAARTLSAIDVRERGFSARMSDFYERREHAIGHFITREDILKRNPVRAYELFEAMPSVRVQLTRDGGAVIKSTRSGCNFQVLVDGLPIDRANFPAPSEIGGIEVYSGPATIPLQYKSKQAGCGVILIWTGDGR